jgi:hypothetical protein
MREGARKTSKAVTKCAKPASEPISIVTVAARLVEAVVGAARRVQVDVRRSAGDEKSEHEQSQAHDKSQRGTRPRARSELKEEV